MMQSRQSKPDHWSSAGGIAVLQYYMRPVDRQGGERKEKEARETKEEAESEPASEE